MLLSAVRSIKSPGSKGNLIDMLSILILHYSILYYHIHFTIENLNLLLLSAEDFWCHGHHYQCLAVPVELNVVVFIFRFIGVGMAETLGWPVSVIVSVCKFYY